MAFDIKKVEYFNIRIDGNAGEIYKLLSEFSGVGVNLLAFKAIPSENGSALVSLFPNDGSKIKEGAKKAGLVLDGPHNAIIVKSNNDIPGECAGIFKKLSQASINFSEAYGIADIEEGYGIVLYLKQEEFEKAFAALEI